MPQLDFSLYISQVFWFVVSFGGLYIFNTIFTSPKFEKIFLQRSEFIEKLQNTLETHQKTLLKLEQEINAEKVDALSKINAIEEKFLLQIQEKRDAISRQLQEEYLIKMSLAKKDIELFAASINNLSAKIKSLASNKISQSLDLSRTLVISDAKRLS